MEELARQAPIGSVDDKSVMIRSANDHLPTCLGHADQLVQSVLRTLQNVKGQEGVPAIEGLVCKGEVVDTPLVKFDEQVQFLGPLPRFRYHRYAWINADNLAGLPA